MKVSFVLNGEPVAANARPDESLLTMLRRRLGVLSVRETCGIGVCGACTALVDGLPVSACLLLAPLVEGARVVTAEALPAGHPVLQAFAETNSFQCGFCIPGMVITAVALLEEIPSPTDGEIRSALAGNLCRCGCYLKIHQAVRRAAEIGSEGR